MKTVENIQQKVDGKIKNNLIFDVFISWTVDRGLWTVFNRRYRWRGT